MKRTFAVVAVLALAGGAVAFVQRPDVAAGIDASVNLATSMRANAADSGVAVDIANYSGVAVQIISGKVDLTTTSKYVVLQDSTPDVAAWVSRDSIAIDSTDNKYYDLTYRGFRRYVRLIQRASGGAGDTVQTTGLILKTGARSR